MRSTSLRRCSGTAVRNRVAVSTYFVTAARKASQRAQELAGQLLTFVAGEADVVERCRPVFQAYTRQVINVGSGQDTSVRDLARLGLGRVAHETSRPAQSCCQSPAIVVSAPESRGPGR